MKDRFPLEIIDVRAVGLDLRLRAKPQCCAHG
jgi:hypothetical protein